jgi:hypothetical protein
VGRRETFDREEGGPPEADAPNKTTDDCQLPTDKSVDDGVDDLRELAAGLGQGVEIMFAGATRLDQPAMAQEREVVADGRLALGAQIGAQLGDVPLFFTQEHEHLKAGRIRDLLQQLGDSSDL